MSMGTQSKHNFLSGYKVFSLPNLSTVRISTTSIIRSSVHLHHGFSDITVLVALARCLGAYSEVNDVLLGFVSETREYAARIQWTVGQSWTEVMQNAIIEEIGEDEVRQRMDISSEGQSPFIAVFSRHAIYRHPLSFILSGDRLDLHLASLYFHESTAAILATQIQSLVFGIISRPDGSCTDLSALSANVMSFSKPSEEVYTHLPNVSIVTDYVRDGARNVPSSRALEYYANLNDLKDLTETEDHAQTFTYQELHTASNQFAHYLVTQGINSEDRIAICMPRNLEFHVILLGVMKVGACYVSIDPELPDERRNFIIEDSTPRIIFSKESFANHIQAAKSYSREDINLADPGNLAYLLYTSGTTGVPKGCLLTHRGLSEAILALSSFAFEAGSENGRYLAVASIAFDVHLAEIFVPLALGMTLVTASRDALFEDLPYWIQKFQITHVGIVPSLIEATMNAVEESASEGGIETSLRYIASGGEKMTDAILERWANHPRIKLANFYGPSEVTIGCAARFMSRDAKRENVGRIFASCSVYVVDQDLTVVMRNAPGELLVTGPLVGKGYHGRPDLTARAFLEWKHQWVYRTGDLVRMMPDDTIEIIGRIDSQIKLNGVRIESEGISSILRNAALMLEPKVDLEVITLLARHPSMQIEQLVSFINYGQSVDVSIRRSRRPQVLFNQSSKLLVSLQEECCKSLPSYMRPAHLIPLDFIPLSSNGKADNKTLKSLFEEIPLKSLIRLADEYRGDITSPSRNHRKTLTGTERRLMEIIAMPIGITSSQLNASSNLFSLGYDSIKMIQLASNIREQFPDISEPILTSDLMLFPTTEQIASVIDTRHDSKSSESPDAITFLHSFAEKWSDAAGNDVDAERVENILPTFPLQDGVLYRSMDSHTLYIEHITLRCHDGISLDRLNWSWKQAMNHYEILRAVFLFHEQIIQVILRPEACRLPWDMQIISDVNESDFINWFRTTRADNISEDIINEISSSPPFRLNVFMASKSNFITLSIHHSIYDGISISSLFQSIEELYFGAILTSKCKIIDALSYVYSADYKKAEEFWEDHFKDFDWTSSYFTLASLRKIAQQTIPFKIQLSELTDLAMKAQCTIEALMVASYAICLDHYIYRSQDIVFGTIRSGRSSTNDHINNAIYPLLSVQPIRISTASFTSILSSAQSAIANAIRFEHVPLIKIKHWVKPRGELFETVFSISFQIPNKARLYDIVDNVQPDSDYIFAVEIVLDKCSGKVTVQATYNEKEISLELVTCVLRSLESTAISLANQEDIKLWKQTNGESKELIRSLPSNAYSDIQEASEEFEGRVVNVHLEVRLRNIIAEFLNVDEKILTSTTSLLSLGFDSIKAMGLSKRLRKENLNVTAVDLMKYSAIRPLINHCLISDNGLEQVVAEELNLLKKLQRTLADFLDVPSLKLSSDDEIVVYPTTDLQAGMLSQTISSNGLLYVHVFPFQLLSTIRLLDLKQAWNIAIKTLSILRTSFHFVVDVGSWAQVIHSEAPMHWFEKELDNAEDFQGYIANYMHSIEMKKAEDFSRPPVRLNYVLNKQTGERHLLLVMHHALYDGTSISRLLEFVEAIYKGKPVVERPQFHDFLAYFQRQELYGTSFWVEYLKGYEQYEIKSFRYLDIDTSYASQLQIPLTSVQLDVCCKKLRVTAQCFGQAAWAKVLATLLHTDDVVFGQVVSGRQLPSSEDIIGPILSTIPCRVIIPAGKRNADLLRYIHDRNVSALDWQHASLRSINRKLATSAVWFSLFLFQPTVDNLHNSIEEDRLWKLVELQTEDAKIQYPISIELHQDVDHLVIKGACHLNFMNREDLDFLLKFYSNILCNLVNQPYVDIGKDMNASGSLISESIFRVLNTGIPYKKDVKEIVVWPPRFLGVRDSIASMVGLRSEELNLNTSLLSLGIDSISAIQLSAKLRKLGFWLAAADILRCNVLWELVRVLDKSSSDDFSLKTSSQENGNRLQSFNFSGSSNSIYGASIESTWPLSPGMKWLIGAWQHSRRSRYQHAFAFRLPSNVLEHNLRQAWFQLIVRHPILRSSFASSETGLLHMLTYKNIADHLVWTVKHYDKENLTDETVVTFLRSLVSIPFPQEQIPHHAFFLSNGSSNGSSSNYLVIRLHHFQYDAWSLQLLLEDFDDLYNGRVPLNDSSYSYFLACFTGSSVRQQQEAYWRTYFSDTNKPSYFPQLIDETHAIIPSGASRGFYTEFEALTDFHRLKKLAQSWEVSLDMIFLASWARVQASYTGDSSTTFGVWHLGRSGGLVNISSLAIPCLNILPLHIPSLPVNTPLLETATLIQKHLRERSPVIEQSDLEMIDEWVDGKGQPLCNVFVNIVKMKPEQKMAGKLLIPVDAPYFIPNIAPETAESSLSGTKIVDLIKDDIVIDIVTSDPEGKISMTIEYEKSFLSEGHARRLIWQWADAIKELMTTQDNTTIRQ